MTESKSPAIQMRDVSVVRSGVTILADINWAVPRGHYVALLGPNGSGKTTLTRVMTGFMWPSSGEVSVLDRTLGHTDVRELRQHIAIVDPSERFGVDGSMTTDQVVLTGFFATLYLYETGTREQIERAQMLLDTVGLSHRREHRFATLSTGEQRRCLLARALVETPPVLILDEPTSGLDIYAREHLLATIEQLRQHPDPPTIVMVTHHVEEISPDADQVLLLKQGRIAAQGTPAHVISPESLTDVFGCRVYVQKRSGRYWLEVLPEAWVELLDGRPPNS